MEKAAAIKPVIFVIVRNVVGHNIWFCFRFGFGWQVASHLSLPIRRAFIPEIFDGSLFDRV
jgi:hypothetical protein